MFLFPATGAGATSARANLRHGQFTGKGKQISGRNQYTPKALIDSAERRRFRNGGPCLPRRDKLVLLG
jgi:hypothetical protein